MAKVLTVRIDTKLEKQIARLARSRGVTESEVVRDILDRSLWIDEFRRLRARTVPLAREAGYVTDDDVFRDVS